MSRAACVMSVIKTVSHIHRSSGAEEKEKKLLTSQQAPQSREKSGAFIFQPRTRYFSSPSPSSPNDPPLFLAGESLVRLKDPLLV